MTACRLNLKTRITLALATLACAPVAGASVAVDSFGFGSPLSTGGSGSFVEQVASVLGGVREIAYDFSSALPGNNLTLLPGAGLLLSATFNYAGIDSVAKTFTLTYDGDASSGKNLNLNLSSANAFVVNAMADLWAAPAGGSVLALSLTDTGDVTRTMSLYPNGNTNEFVDFVFPLADAAFADVNLTHIDRVSLRYTSALNADTVFNNLYLSGSYSPAVLPVPEADSYILFLVGMGLLGVLARRRS